MDSLTQSTPTDSYALFLAQKHISAPSAGFEVDVSTLNAALFPWQRDIVAWALRRGRAALFEDCGLGKTLQQIVWADEVARHTNGKVLILAPLAVAAQTVHEGEKFGVKVTLCRSQQDVRAGINITNYEMLHHFDASAFDGVVLDESSILKSYSGATRTLIVESFRNTPYRLACTATPAPNDYMELGNHAEFLGIMSRIEMLATFFVHDGGDTSSWRLKGHAETEFWRWLCEWAVTLRNPADLGYDGSTFVVPPLQTEHHVVESVAPEGMLFAIEAQTLTERRQARKASMSHRIQTAVDLVIGNDDAWIIWCDLNAEGDALERTIPGAVQVAGRHDNDVKERAMLDFAAGKIRVLITKPSICGWGMNWQHCHNVCFVGLSDSYEQYYQAIRRCWRFGQQHEVACHLITSEAEGAVIANIRRKEHEAERMQNEMIEHMHSLTELNIKGSSKQTIAYAEHVARGQDWTSYHGDCVDTLRQHIADNSIDYSVFSPPFASLYTYSNSERDMGNSRTYDDFMQHYLFLVKEQYRTLKPGRLLSFHCMLLPTTIQHHGYIGIQDFRGDLIRIYQEAGFIFHSEVVIWKDPVTAMQRTKALGLLYKQIKKDAAMSRQGIPDYLVTMRKPGINPDPVRHDPETFPVGLWQRYASPVWMDINPSNTLQKESAREEKDERHIAPLQLEVIERAIELWTNPGDLVLSPFMGIGSEGFMAVKMGRRFVGAELKHSYWQQAVGNLQAAEQQKEQRTMFDLLEEVG